jgi:DNA repair exonuclease SbcCD ATPase subunit
MSESPIKYLLQNRKQVLSTFTGSPVEAWKRLKDQIQIEKAMSENTFRALIKNFVEVCQYFEAGLNTGLNETIDGLNNQLNNEQELNDRLNNQVRELNNRLNTLERLNEKLNNEIERLNNTEGKLNNMDVEHGLNKKLNIEGWTVAKSGRYFRAFRKINGRVVGIHIGLTLAGAAEKIKEKAAQITGQ